MKSGGSKAADRTIEPGRRLPWCQPARNISCRHYGWCLTLAALHKRQDLRCSICAHKSDKVGQVFDQRDIAGCLALATAVLAGLPADTKLRNILDAVESAIDDLIQGMTGDRAEAAEIPGSYDDL